MTLQEFLSLGPAHDLSASAAHKLNASLSMASIEDIPDEQLRMVRDYLLCALNMDSVEPALASRLEKLRVSLDDALQR